MKKQFSTSWKASKRKSKQRKYRFAATHTVKHEFMSANLSKELRKKYGRRNFPVRKGDEVLVMRGKFKGKKGKVAKVNMKKLKASIEGIQIARKDGTKVNVYFQPSKMQIQALNTEDKERLKALERNKASSSKLKGEKVQ
jgi:large subunit ribosomal protein L24